MLRNITDEKNSFLKLQEAKKISDQANNTKSVFLSTMSHEIRTPLNAIIGYSTLLSKTKLGNVQSDYNDKIKLSGEMLISLANNILDLTKIEADKLIIEKKLFSIRKVIE